MDNDTKELLILAVIAAVAGACAVLMVVRL